ASRRPGDGRHPAKPGSGRSCLASVGLEHIVFPYRKACFPHLPESWRNPTDWRLETVFCGRMTEKPSCFAAKVRLVAESKLACNDSGCPRTCRERLVGPL